MTDPAVTAAAEATHDFLIDCGLTDAEADYAATAAVAAVRPVIEAEVRERIAAEQEAAGRAEVAWLAQHASDDVDRARLIGAEDAWKAAISIARGGTRD